MKETYKYIIIEFEPENETVEKLNGQLDHYGSDGYRLFGVYPYTNSRGTTTFMCLLIR